MPSESIVTAALRNCAVSRQVLWESDFALPSPRSAWSTPRVTAALPNLPFLVSSLSERRTSHCQVRGVHGLRRGPRWLHRHARRARSGAAQQWAGGRPLRDYRPLRISPLVHSADLALPSGRGRTTVTTVTALALGALRGLGTANWGCKPWRLSRTEKSVFEAIEYRPTARAPKSALYVRSEVTWHHLALHSDMLGILCRGE